MTVVVVNDFAYVNGGASQVALDTAIQLKKRGHRVILFTAVEPVDARLTQYGIEVVSTHQKELIYYKNKLIGALNGLWNEKAKQKLDGLLKGLDPAETIVHVHMWIKALSHSIFKSIVDNHFKFVITVHDYFLACPNGGFYNYQKQEICVYCALSGHCLLSNCDKRNYAQKVFRVIRTMIQNKLFKIYSPNLIFISNFSERILKEQLAFPYHRYFLRNPVNAIPSSGIAQVSNPTKYLFIGRLSPEKGADLFCEAMKRTGCQGVVIGDGECRSILEKQYQGCDNIAFKGWLTHDEIGRYLQVAKALIISSRWYETAVLTIPEVQFSYPIPVIVGDQCAGSDFVENNQNGLIFHSGDISSLVKAIEKVESKAFQYDSQYICHYQKEQELYIDNLVNIYNKILGGYDGAL